MTDLKGGKSPALRCAALRVRLGASHHVSDFHFPVAGFRILNKNVTATAVRLPEKRQTLPP